jgi:hypothetical protein
LLGRFGLLGLFVIAGCGFKSGGLQVGPNLPDGGGGAGGGVTVIITDALPADGARDGVANDGARADGVLPADTVPGRGDGALPEVRPTDLVDSAAEARALLLVGALPAVAADGLLRQHLERLGFAVEVLPMRTAREAAAATTAAAGQRVIVLSASLPGIAGLAAMLSEVAVPIVCLNPEFLEDLAIGDSPFGEEIGNSMAILLPDHPLAAGRSGRVQVTGNNIRLIFGHPVPGATVIATGPDDNILVTVFALERGAAGAAGPTRARRVAWLAQEATISALNAEGWALLEAAIAWAATSP